MKDSFESLTKAAITIKSASSTILSASGAGEDLADVTTALNDVLRSLAEKPGIIDARAAWDAMEIETINNLDRVINDNEVAAGIREAATAYKTSVQKMAIFGRAMAEHQAAIDGNNHEIATLLLQRCVQIEKRAVSRDLADKMQDRATLNAHIRTQLELELDVAARSFFVASYGFRRAQYFESFTLPATPIALQRTASQHASTLAGLDTDLANLKKLVDDHEVDFENTITLREPSEIENLIEGKAVLWPLSLQDVSDRPYTRIRLVEIELRLDGVHPSNTIGFLLSSTGSFTDRGRGEQVIFTGEAVSVPFEYDIRGITTRKPFRTHRPAPFTDWLITLEKGAKEELRSATALHLTLKLKGLD